MDNDFKKDLDTYFYDEQIRSYIIQFMAIFSGLQVSVGKNNFNSTKNLMYVPIRYGNSSRIVDAILSENTQNKPIRLPMFAADFAGMEQVPSRRKGVGTFMRHSVLPAGGSLPDDIKVVYQAQPIPYDGLFELSMYCSNEDQHLQILEQILMIFDPVLQIQTSDDFHDLTKITSVELVNVDFNKNYPKLADKRVIVTSLNFRVQFYLSPPVNIKQNFIKSIKLRLDTIRTQDDIWEKVTDVTREDPPYKTLFDADTMDIPPN
jgi:hypothetical protein